MPIGLLKRAATRLTRKAGSTILLTGAHHFLGRLVLRRLSEDRSVGTVLSLGAAPAKARKVRPVRSTLLNPRLPDLLKHESVDAVVHLDFIESLRRDESIFEHNVLGTLQLLTAALELGVRRIVVRSSTMVYGAKPTSPNFLPETRRIGFKGAKSQYVRDAAEMERYLQELLDQHPDASATILRFAPIVGPTSDSPFMKYLRLPSCPTVLGFDPLFQLLHEEDAAAAVVHALGHPVRGPVNVCPDGVAPLLRILRLLGRKTYSLPPFFLGFGERMAGALAPLPLDASMLRFTLGGDNARMKQELGFLPRRTTSETLHALRENF